MRTTNCPYCHAQNRGYTGEKIKCFQCGEEFNVPHPDHNDLEGLDPLKDEFQDGISTKTFKNFVQQTIAKLVRKVFDLPDYSKRGKEG